MSYAKKTAYYRNEFHKCLETGDRENAKRNAVGYVKVLREMASVVKDLVQRAWVSGEADWYENIAVMIAREGVSERVKRVVKEGVGKRRALLQNPSAPIPCSSPKAEYEPASVEENGEGEWIADVFEKRLPATLVVETENGVGTGFFVSPNGLFVTNHHVVHDGNRLSTQIRVASGDEKIRCGATFIATNKKRDFALLKAEIGDRRVPFIPLIEEYAAVRQGTDVMAIGNALSYGLAPITGTVKFPHVRDNNDMVYTAPSNHGDSGGPVLNRKGECVGINKSITVSVRRGNQTVKTQGLTNATPADEMKKMINEWKEKFEL